MHIPIIIISFILAFVTSCKSEIRSVSDIVHLDILQPKIIHLGDNDTFEFTCTLRFTNQSDHKISFQCTGNHTRLITFGEFILDGIAYRYTPISKISLKAKESRDFCVRFPVEMKNLKSITYKYPVVYWEWNGLSQEETTTKWIESSHIQKDGTWYCYGHDITGKSSVPAAISARPTTIWGTYLRHYDDNHVMLGETGNGAGIHSATWIAFRGAL